MHFNDFDSNRPIKAATPPPPTTKFSSGRPYVIELGEADLNSINDYI